jgi:MYXO-CTERM domain-containing protein
MKRSLMSRAAPFALWFLISSGCGAGGCDCVNQIPGGFPAEERVPNMVQFRVSDTGLQAIEADPGALIGGLIGEGMGLTFDVPASCDVDDNPQTCCDDQLNPVEPCGPIIIDLDEQQGDAPRLEITPIQGSSSIDVVARARVRTQTPIPIIYDTGIFVVDCDVNIDTEAGAPNDDLLLRTTVDFVQNATTGTTDIVVGDVTIEQLDEGGLLEPGDVSLDGGFTCTLGNLGIGLFIDTLTGTFSDAIKDAITDQVCKGCPSGDVADCGAGATSCDGEVCMIDDVCMQELGISGRMPASALFGSLSPGTLGALDLYEVAGGYATSDDGGLALGFLGGFEPGGAERDRCGPSAIKPEPVTIPESPFFTGNTRPDTNGAFDFAVGVHEHNLDVGGWAAYEGGFLCLSIGTRSIDLLNSETLAILFPSFIDLLHAETGQIVLGLRPQKPPIIELGLGTFIDGEIDEPLLDITLPELDVDIYGMVDDAWIRLMTLTADVNLPLNLSVTADGELEPVLGDLEDAFTNLTVSNSEALVETPEELADKFPALLSLALPLVADGLGSFALPELGGLTLKIADDGITAVPADTKEFLAIFGTFELAAQMAAQVVTEAEVVDIVYPATEVFAAPTWDRAQRPHVELALGGYVDDGTARELEWSFRVDGGLWSPYTRKDRVKLSRDAMWLQGRHTVEVRARVVGEPSTADRTPVVLRPIIDTIPPRVLLAQPTSDSVTVMATDNVSRGALTMEYRLADGDWTSVALPAAIDLRGHDTEDLEVRIADEAGNHAGGSTNGGPTIAFHGSAEGSGGCDCAVGGDPESLAGSALLVLLLGLGLIGPRRRRRLVRATARVVPTVALWVGVATMLSVMPACDCGGTDTNPCFGGECLEGEVERGPTGRYNSIAASADRVVVSCYDEELGDLVLIDIAGEEMIYEAVDGVPTDQQPVYEPSTYRDGVVAPGADVGAWTSIALVDGYARIAYQDVDNGTLKLARETEDGVWQIHTIDPGDDGEVGLHTSLAIGPDGVPAVAYMAINVDDGGNGRLTQLRYARAGSANPIAPGDWTIEVLDEAPASCAGACNSRVCAEVATDVHQCVTETSDCGDACDPDTEVCTNGSCLAAVPDPPAYDIPEGSGLWPTLGYLPDGRDVITYYDRSSGDLAMQVFAGAWTTTIVDSTTTEDTGMWAHSVVDSSGIVHIAYQDALGDRLLYTTWNNGTIGPVDVVDDGVRDGDRAHAVGASAAVMLTGSGVAIAYQDGLSSDMMIAQNNGSGWTHGPLETGIHLYGFFINSATGGGSTHISSYVYDRAIYPPGELLITPLP